MRRRIRSSPGRVEVCPIGVVSSDAWRAAPGLRDVPALLLRSSSAGSAEIARASRASGGEGAQSARDRVARGADGASLPLHQRDDLHARRREARDGHSHAQGRSQAAADPLPAHALWRPEPEERREAAPARPDRRRRLHPGHPEFARALPLRRDVRDGAPAARPEAIPPLSTRARTPTTASSGSSTTCPTTAVVSACGARRTTPGQPPWRCSIRTPRSRSWPRRRRRPISSSATTSTTTAPFA